LKNNLNYSMREVVNEPRKLVAILGKSDVNEDIREFVHSLNKRKRGSILSKHFLFNGKRGYLVHRCKGSPFIAARMNGIILFPWEMFRAPRNFYENERNRIDAIRWSFVIKKFTVTEFRKEFAYLLKYYGNSAAKALRTSDFIFSKNEGWDIEPQFNVKEWYKDCKIRWLLN